MQSFPSDVLNDLRRHLEEEKTKTMQRIAELSAQDPFSDLERSTDAASDTDANEESSHDRFAAMMEEEQVHLSAIDRALQRIADGTYGICANCKKMINTDRLAALPTAEFCLDCESQKKK
jgi:DnaK suppressor protein